MPRKSPEPRAAATIAEIRDLITAGGPLDDAARALVAAALDLAAGRLSREEGAASTNLSIVAT